MPAFGRIGRHHNRSQQGLVDPGGEVAAGSGSGSGLGGSAASHPTPGPSGSAPPSGPAGAAGAPSSSSHSHSSSLAPALSAGSGTTTANNAAGANSLNQITPHSASSTAFSSSESFDIHPNQLAAHQQHQLQQQQLLQQQQQHQQGQQGPSPLQQPHDYHPPASTSRNSLLLQHHNPPIADLRQRSQQDYTDSVSRSQSQRYPPGVAPYSNNAKTGAASSSVDNLRTSVNSTSSASASAQPQATSPLPQQQPAPVPEKRSARKLLRNILGGSGRDHHNTPPPQPTPPSSYDNTGGLARRPSKRNPDSNRNSIRYVPTDFDNTPYEEADYGDRQPQQIPTVQEQQQHGQQPAYDPSQQQYQQQYSNQQPGQYQAGPPTIYTSHLGAGSHQNPETVSQLSHESPITDSDALSANVHSNQTSPAVRYAVQTTDSPLPSTLPPAQQGGSQAQQQQSQQQNMAPPSGGPPPNRRSQETEKALRSQVDASAGPPGYRQSQTMPPTTGSANAAFRPGGAADSRQFEGATGEQGRNSPQPSNPDRDGTDPDKFKELLTKYKNVKRLYFDGKTQIDNLNSQIEVLQNAVANQRMSQSRTALDDSEYITRFSRLNGAINNLSFNIRKDWRTVPQWLDMFVSIDALKTGKQEMTAVGRAVITRWIVEEIFNKCFHPGLNFELSRQLKEIELNIRRFSYTMSSQEEFDALTNKVVSWRMATLEGLQRVLNSPESADNRADFTRMCTSNLTATLFQYMTDPPPAGVDGSASMIVELAVGIAANLPLESRDVAINYPLPGDPIQLNIMDVEKTPLPPLEIQKAEGEAEADEGDKDKSGKNQRADKTKSALPPKDNSTVRLAGFPVVEVRGRQVLVKATVWAL
ncbi:S-adenosylmethionine-dependent methyltransferase-like protein [Colletotrichum scovillei]|uniref:S-adenosylmethionine-dependent methyltransferase-like protein n=1 Tax=Colletotrichum scovillei TaxID=1209932 RepID=A0A9P7UD59_9PEZI|nr:S-adenosylmethionine-dependent methyltransferase-like protein [Colletotrichum scovillei]KAG7070340.1 S-adenosylmethionine-dependent methyltransferase-like protein [Colletotrichum scovillei]KAG7078588.1 S-adenosylmethionine-dependent methyltransferase-like protein [Colletotrichum scovillei]